MRNEPGFKLPFVGVLGEGEKTEVVWIPQQLLCQVGLGGWRRPLKIRDRFPLALKEPCLNLKHEHVPAPAVLDGRLGVPESLVRGLYRI